MQEIVRSKHTSQCSAELRFQFISHLQPTSHQHARRLGTIEGRTEVYSTVAEVDKLLAGNHVQYTTNLCYKTEKKSWQAKKCISSQAGSIYEYTII